MLTSYRGVSITYDAIDNPLSYYNGSSYSFSWTGRQLIGATKGGVIIASPITTRVSAQARQRAM